MDEHYLAKILPEDYMQSAEVVEIQDAIQVDLETEQDAVNGLQDQMFVETATVGWGLSYWEKLYGIYPDITMSVDDRREVVLGKVRGVGTVTPAFIKALAETFVEGEVEVIEDTTNCHFQIKIISVVGEPPRLNAMKAAIEEMKPAHLTFEIVIRYNTWGDVKAANYTWAMAKTRTWGQLRGEAL